MLIPLTRGHFAIVDPDDHDRMAAHSWWANEAAVGRFYAVRREGGRLIYMHRVLMGADRGSVVDHADGNSLNNARSNLRITTQKLNSCNTRRGVGASGFRGVTQTRSGRWRARIGLNGAHQSIGTYDTALEAAMARDAAATAHFGEFAVLNSKGEQ